MSQTWLNIWQTDLTSSAWCTVILKTFCLSRMSINLLRKSNKEPLRERSSKEGMSQKDLCPSLWLCTLLSLFISPHQQKEGFFETVLPRDPSWHCIPNDSHASPSECWDYKLSPSYLSPQQILNQVPDPPPGNFKAGPWSTAPGDLSKSHSSGLLPLVSASSGRGENYKHLSCF